MLEMLFLLQLEGSKLNPQKWVVKKRGSHVGELDQKLKLATVDHHNDRVIDEVHMTQSVGPIAVKKEVG